MRNAHLIDSYCSYFLQHLGTITRLPDTMYRKALMVIVLDTLAVARVGRRVGNRERFVELVSTSCDWADAARVSLPQLSAHLSAGSRLGREVQDRLRAWQVGRVYTIEADPISSDLVPFASDKTECKIIVEQQHINLLYQYRNMLVHEFREPGYDMGMIGDDGTPYYMSMNDEAGRERWELGYPFNFFARLVERALVNLKAHLSANDLDPYSLYEFGSTWRPVRSKGKA